MGNFCENTTPIQQRQEDRCSRIHQQEQPPDQNTTFTVTTTADIHYMGTPDPMGTGSGSSRPCSRTDPRLLSLLEFFRQLYERKKDVFRRIVPVRREEFEEIFTKMGVTESKKKKMFIIQRCNSFGDVESVRLSRFKVKPIDSGGAGAGAGAGGGKGGGGGGSNKPAGSK